MEISKERKLEIRNIVMNIMKNSMQKKQEVDDHYSALRKKNANIVQDALAVFMDAGRDESLSDEEFLAYARELAAADTIGYNKDIVLQDEHTHAIAQIRVEVYKEADVLIHSIAEHEREFTLQVIDEYSLIVNIAKTMDSVFGKDPNSKISIISDEMPYGDEKPHSCGDGCEGCEKCSSEGCDEVCDHEQEPTDKPKVNLDDFLKDPESLRRFLDEQRGE